jgi:hypothetical protein
MRSRSRCALPLAALLAGAGALSAQTPAWHVAQPERPTVATHAYPVAPGVLEIEAGVQAFRPDGYSETDAPVVVKFGVARGLQVEFGWGWTSTQSGGQPSTSGVTDLTIAPKVPLLHGAPVLANFSVQPSLKLPTGSLARGTGTGTTDVGLLLISSRTLGRVSVDLNAGITRRSGDGSNAPRTATFLTFSSGYDLGHSWGWVLEVFGYPGTAGAAGKAPQVGLLTGPTLIVRPWLVLDLGVVGNVEGFPGNSAYAGVTWNIGRIPHWPGS